MFLLCGARRSPLPVFALALFLAAPAHASGPGSIVLARAAERWKLGAFAMAERLYADAIDRGQLSPSELLDCYAHLGAARVIQGNAGDALAAFREAARLDPRFAVPREGGPKAITLAQQARQETQRAGAWRISAELPAAVSSEQPFRVAAELPKEQAARAMSVRVLVVDPASGKSYQKALPAEARVAFDIPPGLGAAGGALSIQVDALDEHDNRLASSVKKVRLEPSAVYVAAPDGRLVSGPPISAGAQPDADGAREDGAEKPAAKGGANGKKVAAAAGADDASDAEGEAAASGDDAWNIPHGSKKYTAVRADKPPIIDGKLDDPIWQLAPRDARFLSTRSKPFGQPTSEPTTVQLAYDDRYLYVAFRCAYSKKGQHDDSYAGDETTLLTEAESASVIIDAVHGHTGAYQFSASPVGVRGDVELSDQGSVQNLDWHGIWDVETAPTADGWTAEFRIPWGTMRMPGHEEAFDLGINFARREPISGEYAIWALHPPATEIFDTTFFGHLDGLADVHPGQRLFLLPYIALGYDSSPPDNNSPLNSVTGTNPRPYIGGYIRFRPPGPVQVDATFNPDFSAVTPDQALANFDRFELEYPEVRPFFAEDTPRFQFGAPRYLFGDLGAQLFYSRRLGIDTNTAGLTEAQPILWGVKSVLRAGGTEAALMNVETSPAQGPIAFADNSTVGRITQTFEGGQRIGAIFLSQQGADENYVSGGVDGSFKMFDRHLEFSGFYAASQTNGAASAAGEGTVSWRSQDVYAKATYLDIGTDFQAPLGFFPLTGVRAEMFAAGYSPVVHNDRVQQVFFDAQLSIARNRADDAPIYQRGTVAVTIATPEQAMIQALVMPATENVATPFPIGNGRITVPAGVYSVMVTGFNATTAPGRPVVFGVGYQGGDLYGGTRRSPSVSLGLNLGRFVYKLSYALYLLHYGTDTFTGHDLQANASYSYTPLIKSTLLFEADTVAARATVQLATTWQFGQLSALTFSLRGNSGSTIDTAANDLSDNPTFSAILSLSIGVSPF